MNILFLCTGNACRSILAEAIFNQLAPAGYFAMSAGSQPTGVVHPNSLKTLQKHQIDINGLHSKSWQDLPNTPDIVVTVCASAAGETCPVYLSNAMRTHWGLADPAKATGTEEAMLAVFEETYQYLVAGIQAFLSLPLAELTQSPQALQQALDKIGQDFFTSKLS